MPSPTAAKTPPPQDVPVEAREPLEFTPPSLAEIAGAPCFTLRVATTREKRARKLLLAEEGAVQHSPEKIREETLRGLKALWTPEHYDEFAPVLEAYWHAWDDYEAQKKDDPDLVWEWDVDEEEAIQRLWVDVSQSHRPLAKMNAQNAMFGDIAVVSTVAVMVSGFTGLTVHPDRVRGYLTIDCADEIQEALGEFERRHGLDSGKAWGELVVAAIRRMFLDEDEGKNSASPSPSTSPQPSSKETAEGPGPSTASEPSTTETPASE